MARGPARRAVSTSSSSDDSDVAPAASYPKFTIEDYNNRNQPLTEAGASKLNNLKMEWNSDAQRLEALLLSLSDAAEELAEAYADEEDSEEWRKIMEELDQRAKSIIDNTRKAEFYGTALHTTRQRILRQEKIVDAPKELEKKYDELVQNYQSQTERQRYGKHKSYAEFRSRLWAVFHPESNMPAVASLLPLGEGEESDSDEEVQRGQAMINPKCPITMEYMLEPYTCTVCHHSYSKSGFEDYLRHYGATASCPVAGCSVRINRNNTLPDETLRKRIQRFLAKKQKGQKTAFIVGDEDSDEEATKEESSKNDPDSKVEEDSE